MIPEVPSLSFFEAFVAAAIAAVMSPTLLWLAAKGKLDERYVTKEKVEEEAASLKADIDGVGGKYDALLSLYNQTRSDLDATRDRCTMMEARQDPVTQGVQRMEQKLDKYLDRQGEMEKVQATHSEQLKTLFNNRRST